MDDNKIKDKINKLSKKSKYYEDLYDIFWKISEDIKIKKEHYDNISIGLFNIPCAGFGDIIVCKTFYDYLKAVVSYIKSKDMHNKSRKI